MAVFVNRVQLIFVEEDKKAIASTPVPVVVAGTIAAAHRNAIKRVVMLWTKIKFITNLNHIKPPFTGAF